MIKSSEQPAHDKCLVCCVLPVNTTVVVIAGIGSGQRMVQTHPGPKKSALFHPAFPVLFCHRALLTTKISTCILEIMAPWTLWKYWFRWF